MNTNHLVSLTAADGRTRGVAPLGLDKLISLHDSAEIMDRAGRLGHTLSNTWVWIGVGLAGVWGLS